MIRVRRGAYDRRGVLLAVSTAFLTTIFVILVMARSAGAAASTTIEAESMTLNPSTAGKVGLDSSAMGGGYLFIWSNAGATKSITTTTPTDEVVLRARGDQCQGAPQATVLIDGQQIMSKTIPSETWVYYAASASIPAGTHTVEVRFVNDYRNSSCDQNLRVDQVSLKNSNATEDNTTEPLLFSDSFDREADEFTPPWNGLSRAYSDRLTTSSAITRKGTHSAKFMVHNDDVAPLTNTSNPRAQLDSGKIFCEGDERWVGQSIYFPSNFPVMPSGGWLIVGEQGFASPYNGSPPASFVVRHPGDNLKLVRDESYGRDTIWETSLTREEWQDIVVHTKFSRDPSVGYIELWLNGERQTFSNGKDRIYYPTLEKESTGCGHLQLKNYRQKGMFSWATVYYDEVKVGNSYRAVAP